jgi:hypothetical protein
MKRKKLLKIKDLCLMMGMFFLPFGYDFIFKSILDFTGSYWLTDIIFYIISGCFFIGYLIANKKLKQF